MVWLADRPAMTIAVDLGRKATKQTKIASHYIYHLLKVLDNLLFQLSISYLVISQIRKMKKI